MSTVDRLKVAVSSLVIVGFVGIFSWALFKTWSESSSIAGLQKAATDADRDREDAGRRYERAKADAATAKDNKDAHAHEIQFRAEQVDVLTKHAAEAAAAASTARAVFSDNINYLATALAGLVGTVVVMMFGQELGEQKVTAPHATPAVQSAAAASDLLSDFHGWRRKLGTLYAITYFLFGAVAIATWAFALYSPEMVKNLATISLTLLLAIARSFFN